MNNWETIADNLSKAGWSLGWVSVLDSEGRTIWIVDAHRDDGNRFVVRADEKLTAVLETRIGDSFGRRDRAGQQLHVPPPYREKLYSRRPNRISLGGGFEPRTASVTISPITGPCLKP